MRSKYGHFSIHLCYQIHGLEIEIKSVRQTEISSSNRLERSIKRLAKVIATVMLARRECFGGKFQRFRDENMEYGKHVGIVLKFNFKLAWNFFFFFNYTIA